jgi:DNA-binding transcriptional ArsR family regulator
MLSNTRSNKHSNEDRLDAVFRALSDRTRRALLANLARGPAMVGELAAPFDMSLPAVSRHIRVLEDAKLIVRAVDGRVHRCSLATEPLQDADRWLEHYRSFWSHTLDALDRHVTRNSRRR